MTGALVGALSLLGFGASRADGLLRAELAHPVELGRSYSTKPSYPKILAGKGPDVRESGPVVMGSEGRLRVDGVPAGQRGFFAVLRNKRELWMQTTPRQPFPGRLAWMLEEGFDHELFRDHGRWAILAGYQRHQLVLRDSITREGPLLGKLIGERDSALSFHGALAAWSCLPATPVVFAEPRGESMRAFVSWLLLARKTSTAVPCVVWSRWTEQREAAQLLEGAVEAYRLVVDGHRYQVLVAPREEEMTTPTRGTGGLRVEVRSLVEDDHEDADFLAFEARLRGQGRKVVFLMNGGMYHPDRRPVGLLLHRGQALSQLNLERGRGNFFLLPNGVFETYAGVHSVKASQQWAADSGTILGNNANYNAVPLEAARSHGVDVSPHSRFQVPAVDATQSGPLLLEDGAIHPAFEPSSTSRHRRNGVGIDANGNALFVLSLEPVSLYEFAQLFAKLGCRDALYLDGNVSALYAPELGHRDRGAGLGPVIAATVPLR